MRRKAEVVAAVAGGLLRIDEAYQRYSVSIEDFTSWQRPVDPSAMPGSQITRLQGYRDLDQRRDSY